MKQDGFLVITDITGYTDYLKGSELEHAQDSLRSLLNILIEHTGPPLTISRLEGDAVISYVAKGSFIEAQSIIKRLENMYVAFRQALALLRDLELGIIVQPRPTPAAAVHLNPG